MNLKKSVVLAVAAATFSAGMAMANPAADAIVADLQASNATNIQVKVGLFWIKAEAIVDGSKVERTYTLDGALRKEEVIVGGVKTENTYDATGALVGSQSSVGDQNGDDESVDGNEDDNGVDDSSDNDHGSSSDDDHGSDRKSSDHDKGHDGNDND